MSSSTFSHNIFMNKIDISHDDQGIMNLGKNCSHCNKLDFLPFHCEFCDQTFCSTHRNIDVHNCVGRPQVSVSDGNKYEGPSAASLFPDRAEDKKKLERKFADHQASQALRANAKSTPLMKLTKFLHLQRMKRMNESKTSKLFSRSRSSSSANPVKEILQIKKTAKGSAAVPTQDRIYIWVLYLDRKEEDFDKISLENDRKSLWISKNWSVGRSLDSIADLLNIMNHNNSTDRTSDRLSLFKIENESPVPLELGKKVAATLTNGSTLYLVKGAVS